MHLFYSGVKLAFFTVLATPLSICNLISLHSLLVANCKLLPNKGTKWRSYDLLINNRLNHNEFTP